MCPFVMTFCSLLQNDDSSVSPEKVADKTVSGTDCSDGVEPTEPQSSIGAVVSDAEQGKTTGDIILEIDPVKTAIETGGSAAAGPEKSPAAEPSVIVDADSRAAPTIFVVSDSPPAPTIAAVHADDAAMSTGDDDEETESDSVGEEVDHSVLPLE